MAVTRFPNGITTVEAVKPLGQFSLPDPTQFYTYFNDFDYFNSSEWTITTVEAGAGGATETITNASGGVFVVTNDDADNDSDFFQKTNETFKFTSGKKLFFKSRFKVSDATQSDFVIGLQITDTTPLDVSDGVFFQKDDGDANLDFHVEKNNTATSASAISTVSNDTYLTVAFYYDGDSSIKYYVDDVLLGSSVTTNLPDDEELTISFGIQNGEAAAKVMSVDYIFAAIER